MAVAAGRPHVRGLRVKSLAACLIVPLALIDPCCGTALAASLPVTNCNDAGSGSLRATLAGAHSGDTLDLRTLSCDRIALTSGELVIAANDLALQGPGSMKLTIAAVAQVHHSVIVHQGTGTLRVDSLRITRDLASVYSAPLACIRSTGTLYLNASVVTGCRYGNATISAGLIMSDSTVSNSDGGVIVGAGVATITGSTLSGNYSPMYIGAAANAGTALIRNTTISGNLMSGGYYTHVYDGGAGIVSRPLTITNSTIAFNSAAPGAVGGLVVKAAAVTIESTIFSNNSTIDLSVPGGTTIGGHNNLMMTGANVPSPAGTLGVDAQLQPLGDNGGPTMTHALRAGSPAIDAGSNPAGLATDQRGDPFTRVVGTTADIGAFEYRPPALNIDSGFTGSWFDPSQNGHGLMLEVLPDNRLLALWFAFNPEGTGQSWFGGVGTYDGDTAVITDVVLPSGGTWIPTFDPSKVWRRPWGTLTFKFSDPDHGKVSFDSVVGYGAGSMELLRLTHVASAPAATASPIGPPVSVVADAAGSIFFSSAPDQIFKVDARGSLIHVAGTGTAGYSGDGGPAGQAQLNFPFTYPEFLHDPYDYAPLVGGLALDAAANLYIADAYNNRVRRIDANGIITTVAGNGSRTNAGDGGPATLGGIYWPQGVALDASGSLYVASAYGPLMRVTPDGVLHALSASNCGPGYLGPGLCQPSQIAIDAQNNLFVPDAYCRVREVRADGTFVTVAGADTVANGGSAFTCGYSGDGGQATKAALGYANGVAVDKSGNLYIADTYSSCIRKVNGAGVISTFAGICDSHVETAGYAGDGGAATKARLNRPFGVGVNGAGELYIADTYNNRVRRVSTDGIITTVAGNGAAISAAAAGTIGPGFTGNWFNANQSGHGLMLEVLPDNRLLALWFAFTPTGEQAWFGGVGTYSANTATISAVALPTGGKWIPNFDPNAIVRNPWGSLTLTFSDCNHGKVDFSSDYDGFGSGHMDLTRLTLPAGLSCP